MHGFYRYPVGCWGRFSWKLDRRRPRSGVYVLRSVGLGAFEPYISLTQKCRRSGRAALIHIKKSRGMETPHLVSYSENETAGRRQRHHCYWQSKVEYCQWHQGIGKQRISIMAGYIIARVEVNDWNR